MFEKYSEGPDFDRVFQKMIEPPYRGKVLFNHLSKMSPDDFQPNIKPVSIIRWFRSHPDEFAIFEGNNGRVAMIGIRVKKARLCWKSNRQPCMCSDADCIRFHICKKFICGNCTNARCNLDHHFQSDHSRKLLKRYALEKFNDSDLLTIFRQSHLQICNFYDRKGTCDNEDRCVRAHICADFVNGGCSDPCPKKLKHDFETEHSKRLLRVYDLHDWKMEDVLDQLFICENVWNKTDQKHSRKDELLQLLAQVFHPPSDEDDESEAAGDYEEQPSPKRRLDNDPLKKLNLDCKGSKTTEVKNPSGSEKDAAALSKLAKFQHVSPKSAKNVKWEIEIFGEWKSLGDIRSNRLEKAFCDPNENSVQITLPDVDECLLFDTLINVNLNAMTATLLEGEETLNLNFRRIPNLDDTWLWYYETDEKTWEPYSVDDQELLESAFLVEEKRAFVGRGEIYRIKFSDLTQRNRDTGKERRIRRRPIEQ